MLTFQFIPYNNIAGLDSESRIKNLLSVVKQDKIILLEGRLEEAEEAELIKKTMESISEKFTGIELGVVHPEDKNSSFYKRIQKVLIRILLGNRDGFTIIGPANIITEIKKDPDKIQLYMKESIQKVEEKPKKKGKKSKK